MTLAITANAGDLLVCGAGLVGFVLAVIRANTK